MADPTNGISEYVRFTTWLDGAVVVGPITMSGCTGWTTKLTNIDGAYQIYMQGSQIDGYDVGNPAGPLGSADYPAPTHTVTPTGGYSAQMPQWGDPSSTLEVDYFKAYKFTGGN